jgi:hypothetical protein
MTKVVDNGRGVVLNQTANRYTLTSALATTTIVKTTGALTFGFSTSAKGLALVALVNSMRAALLAAGIAV